MKRIKKYFVLFLTSHFSLLTLYLSAQDGDMYVPRPLKINPASAELGIFLGGSYYTGDLNPSGHFNRFTRPAGGFLYRLNFNSRFSAKAIGSLGILEADDAYSLNDAHHNRNLNFKSKIMEFAVEGEFNFLPYTTGNKKSAITTPYVFAGVAVYHFSPQGLLQGRWYNLQPLGTEGQGTTFSGEKSYSLTQFSIPFGVGMKVNTAKRIGINFEWGLRKTFTDYLDDVSGKYVDPVLLASEKGPAAAALSDKSIVKEGGSNTGRQRGNSFTKDWYSFAGVIITFRMKGNEGECDIPH
ncbi:MAG: outer membrane beta-barrel protein [Bacteroidetes bacterium]|nr:outer membrane beta-barrel protein [Bacteroidota bacterium]